MRRSSFFLILVFSSILYGQNKIESTLLTLTQSLKGLTSEIQVASFRPSKVEFISGPDWQQFTIGSKVLKFQVQDITTMTDVDTIVNAANEGLAAGSGVCGAIYAAVGHTQLENEVKKWKKTNKRQSINTGEAALTLVPANANATFPKNIKYIIHAVGPRCSTGVKMNASEQKLLADAYKNSLLEAEKVGATSIAFPSISTAIFGCPFNEATKIAIKTVIAYLKNNPMSSIKKVVLLFYIPGDTPKSVLNMQNAAVTAKIELGVPL